MPRAAAAAAAVRVMLSGPLAKLAARTASPATWSARSAGADLGAAVDD